MAKKHFIISPDKEFVDKKSAEEIEIERQRKLSRQAQKQQEKNKEKISQKVDLKHVHNRVIISIDLEGKNSHTFSDGQKIYLGRQFNNLNRRETEPVNAYVVSGENIPRGVEILIHPNAIQNSNKIYGFNDDNLDVKYYSIPTDECYLWKDENEGWQPFYGFATALRVFEEYKGPIHGIPHEKYENVLYITSGEFKGKVVRTLKACDYELIFMGSNGVEDRIIRCRHFENENNDREEIIGVDALLTEKVVNKELMVGISDADAKYIIFTL